MKLYRDSVIPSIEACWFDRDFTKKRLRALEHFATRVSWEVTDKLPVMTIIAPSLNSFAEVRRAAATQPITVYLSPTLEFESQPRVDFTVAHEMAHVLLGHGLLKTLSQAQANLPHEERDDELAADALANSWGFKRPKGNSRLSKICAEMNK